MLAFLPHLLGHTDKGLGTLLHIGAGVGSQLADYEALNINNVIAIEADNALFKKLQSKAKRYQNVLAIQGWVAASDQECSVYELSNPRFNSLLAPDELFSHFSNLKMISTKSVMPLAFSDVISKHVELNPAQQNILVLEAQGYEATLIKNCASQELNKFDWVIVRSSEETLYKTGANKTQLIEVTSSLGYECILQDKTHIPFVEYYFRLNRDRLGNIELENRLQVNQETNDKIQATLAETNAQLVNEKETHFQLKEFLKQTQIATNEDSQLITQLKEELITTQNELNTKAESLTANKEVQVNQEEKISHLETEKQNLQSLNASLSNDVELKQNELVQISKVNAELQQQATKQEKINDTLSQKLAQESKMLVEYKQEKQASLQQVDELTQLNGELGSQLDKIGEDLAQQTHWHQENKKWAEGLQTQLYEKTANLDELQKQFNASSALSSKMMLKAQLDLDSLRRDYQNKVESENQLLALIKQLREKLEMAANYYFNLQKDYPELVEKDIPESFGRKNDE